MIYITKNELNIRKRKLHSFLVYKENSCGLKCIQCINIAYWHWKFREKVKWQWGLIICTKATAEGITEQVLDKMASLQLCW